MIGYYYKVAMNVREIDCKTSKLTNTQSGQTRSAQNLSWYIYMLAPDGIFLNSVNIYVGMKCDLIKEREVSFEEGKTWAKAQGLSFIETSGKDRINVVELFDG